MKNGVIVAAIGVVLLIASLVFSSYYSPKRTFLGNIQEMKLIILKGKYVKDSSNYELDSILGGDFPPAKLGHFEGRVAIPTAFPFFASIVIFVTGIVMVILSKIKQSSE